MESMPIWLIWLLVGAALCIMEMFTLTFVMLCFGLGAFASAIAAGLGLNMVVQWGVFLVVSLITVTYARKFADRISGEPTRKANVDRVIGMSGIVIDTIDPKHGSGRVRVDHDEWRAITNDNEVLKDGDHITVESVKGTHLIVTRDTSN